MSFGAVGTVRKLLLCGTVLAAAQGAQSVMSRVMARPPHHPSHYHSKHQSARHQSPTHKSATHQPVTHRSAAHQPAIHRKPADTGKAANAEPAGKPSGARAAAANSPGEAARGKLELVPGPTQVPTPVPRSGANSAMAGAKMPGANGPAGGGPHGQSAATPAAKPGPAQASALPAKPAAPPAASATPAAPPAKAAIATAVAKLFVGEPVYGAKGEQIGKLSKIVTGPDGQVKSAVVSWGGVFGYFQSSRTIPWPEAAPNVQGGKLVLRKMTRDELHNSGSPRPEASR